MARPSSGENLKIIPLNLDPDEVEKFDNNLPKKMSVSKAVRQYIKDENDRIEAEKQLIGKEKNSSPINLNRSTLEKQATLDKFFHHWFMNPDDYETRQKVFETLDEEQLTKVMVCMYQNHEAFKTLKRNREIQIKKSKY